MKEIDFDSKWADSTMPTHADASVSSSDEDPTPTPSEEFVAQDFGPPSYVIQARIYDLLAIIALAVAPDAAKDVLNAHENGRLIGGPPFLIFDADSPEVLPETEDFHGDEYALHDEYASQVEDASSEADQSASSSIDEAVPYEGFVTPKFQDSRPHDLDPNSPESPSSSGDNPDG